MSHSRLYTRILIVPGLLLVTLFVLLPLGMIVPMSFGEPTRGAFTGGGFSFDSYAALITDPRLRNMIMQSLLIALIATLLAITMALPVAYFMSRSGPRLKSFLMLVVLFPLLVGTVVLSIGWMAILSPSGLLSQILQDVGLVDETIRIMRTSATVTALIALIIFPYVLITVLSSLDSVGSDTERAAQSLGASKLRAFFEVTFPQILPGVVAGTTLCFILSVNAYATPVLIGGGGVDMVAPEIYAIITRDGNWPQGTAVSIAIVALTLLISGLYGSLMSRRFEKWRGGS